MSQQDKQAFLRHAIIDNGHNPEHFVAFLTERKENGGDLANWTIDELQEIVQEYTRQSLASHESASHPSPAPAEERPPAPKTKA